MHNCIAQNLSSLGNYAGLATVNNNPSLAVFSKLQYDINFISVNVFAFNNTIYADRSLEYELMQNKVSRSRLFAQAEICGPGVLWVSRNRSIAFTTSFKTIACVNGISPATSDMLFNELKGGSTDSVSLHILDGKQASAASYGELAVSFAKITRNNGTRALSIGYTGKILLGFMATSLSGSNTTLHHESEGNSYITADIRYAYAAPDPDNDPSLIRIRGMGIGNDLGLTYLKRRFAKQRYSGCPSIIKRIIPANDYKWKLSIAVIDVGGLVFNNEARINKLSSVITTLDTLSMKDLKNNYHFDSVLIERAEKNSIENSFYAGLPTSLVVQYDRYIGARFLFIHGYLMQRLTTTAGGIRMFRANQLTVCPRYETPYWELGVKIGIIEYRFPVIGAAVRLKSIHLGIDYITDTSFNAIYGAQVNLGFAVNRIKGRNMPRMRF